MLAARGERLLGLGVDLPEHDVRVGLGSLLEVGANWRHGPHQDAQKSTSTMSLSATVVLEVVRGERMVVMCCLPPTCGFYTSGGITGSISVDIPEPGNA